MKHNGLLARVHDRKEEKKKEKKKKKRRHKELNYDM